jgi:NAD(P)-dependent dehydrogenase (short-subunit alcohol dehydrogenase family)
LIPINLEGKRAVVTGGGRGIGREIAVSLAEAGADVCITARSRDQLEATADLIGKKGKKALIVEGDARLPETADKVVAKTVEEFAGIDILVNNAGMEMMKPLFDCGPQDFDRVMDVNVKSMVMFTKAAGGPMKNQNYGRVVNMASTGSYIAGPRQSLYHASKAACAHFTKATAIEWARYGITVNAIAPGWIDTELISHLTEDREKLDKYLKAVPLRRLGKPEEIGPTAAFLCSDLAGYMTGTVVVIDGGLMIP